MAKSHLREVTSLETYLHIYPDKKMWSTGMYSAYDCNYQGSAKWC